MLTIIYDDNCRFCNRCRHFVEKRARGTCYFVGNGTLEARRLCERSGKDTVPEDTIVTIDEGGACLERFAACRTIARRMGFGWRLFSQILWLIPRPVGDWGYDIMSRSRPFFTRFINKRE